VYRTTGGDKENLVTSYFIHT